MRGVLRKLVERVDAGKLSAKPSPDVPADVPAEAEAGDIITHAWLWPRVSHFLKQDDILVTETGTSQFGVWDTVSRCLLRPV